MKPACLAVPSNQRASALTEYGEKMEDGLRDEGDGWFSTASEPSGGAAAEEIPSLDGPATHKAAARDAGATDGSDNDIPDIDDLQLEDTEEDEVVCPLEILVEQC